MASTRRRVNRIQKLVDDNGVCSEDDEGVCKIGQQYFQFLFSASRGQTDRVIQYVDARV